MSAIPASRSAFPVNPHTTRIFGVPVGDFGLFASTLIAVALGFITFFAVTFLSIFGLLIYNAGGHHHVTLDTGYKFLALPAGIFVLIISYIVLLGIWLRRRFTGH
jgi:hypothetical protein